MYSNDKSDILRVWVKIGLTTISNLHEFLGRERTEGRIWRKEGPRAPWIEEETTAAAVHGDLGHGAAS